MGEEKMLGWICAYTPEEIFSALGLDSFRLYGIGQAAAASLSYFPANFCPLARGCFCEGEEMLRDSSLSGIVLTASCHALVHLANGFKDNACRQKRRLFVYLLDLPRTCGFRNRAARVSFSLSLRDLVRELSSFYGVTWDEGKFWNAVEEHRQVRSLLRRIYLFQQERPESLRAAGVLEAVRAAGRSKKSDFYPVLRSVVEGLLGGEVPAPGSRAEKLLSGMRRRGSTGGPRLLVLGNSIPSVYLDLFEEMGADIVGDDLCQGYRYCLPEIAEEADPFAALARGYLERVPCPRMLSAGEYKEQLRKRLESCRPDGVVYHALKFCDSYLYQFPLIRQFLADEGLPVLYLETEYRGVGLEQARTRVQAFLEMVG
jgi:benzoyl-CoA reductase/2-hydroxyglutaryl-CoA dehydratase subunit BcrC/BadD/HgdB